METAAKIIIDHFIAVLMNPSITTQSTGTILNNYQYHINYNQPSSPGVVYHVVNFWDLFPFVQQQIHKIALYLMAISILDKQI